MNVKVRVELEVDTQAWWTAFGEEPTPSLVAEWVAELMEVSKGRNMCAVELVRLAVVAR